MLYGHYSDTTKTLSELRAYMQEQIRSAHDKGILPARDDMVKPKEIQQCYFVMKTPLMERAEAAYEHFVESGECDDAIFSCLLFLLCAKHKHTGMADEELEKCMAFCALYPHQGETTRHIDTFIVNYMYTFAKSEIRDKRRISSFSRYYQSERHRHTEPLLPSYITDMDDLLRWLYLDCYFIHNGDDCLAETIRWLFFDENPTPLVSSSEVAHRLFSRLRNLFGDSLDKLPGIVMLMYHLIDFMNLSDFRDLFVMLHTLSNYRCYLAYLGIFFGKTESGEQIFKNPDEDPDSALLPRIEAMQKEQMENDGVLVQKLLFPLLLSIVGNYTKIEWQPIQIDTTLCMERPYLKATEVPWLPDFPQEREIFLRDYYIEMFYASIVDGSWRDAKKQASLMNECAKLFRFVAKKPFSPNIVTVSARNFEALLQMIFNMAHYLCGSKSYFVQQVNSIRDEKERILPPCLSESEFKREYKTEDEQRQALNAIKKKRDTWKEIDTGMDIDCFQSPEPFAKYLYLDQAQGEHNAQFRRLLAGRTLRYKFCDESDNTYNYNAVANYRVAHSNNLTHRYSQYDRNGDQHPERRAIQMLMEEKNWQNLLFMLYDCKAFVGEESNWIDVGTAHHVRRFLEAEIDALARLFGSLVLVDSSTDIQDVFDCLKQIDWSGEENKYFKRDEGQQSESKKVVCKKEVFWKYERNAYQTHEICTKNAFYERLKNLLEYMFCITGIADDFFWESYQAQEDSNHRPAEADFFTKNCAEISLYLMYITLQLQHSNT